MAREPAYTLAAASILKVGEVAGTGPVTEMVYVPAVVTASKSIAYTLEKPALHDPRFAPIGPESTVAPLPFLSAKVAPVSTTLDIKYARFDVAAG